MTTICNADACPRVRRQEEFRNYRNTLFAVKYTRGRYVVYSYRLSWPLLVIDTNEGYCVVNEEKVSRTTTQHLGIVRRGIPPGVRVISMPCARDVAYVANHGYAAYAARILLTAGEAA